jgi:hypothetical protein
VPGKFKKSSSNRYGTLDIHTGKGSGNLPINLILFVARFNRRSIFQAVENNRDASSVSGSGGACSTLAAHEAAAVESKENAPLAQSSSSPARLCRKTMKRLDQFRKVDEEHSKEEETDTCHSSTGMPRIISCSDKSQAGIEQNKEQEIGSSSSSSERKSSDEIPKTLLGPECKAVGQGRGILTAATLHNILNKLKKAPAPKTPSLAPKTPSLAPKTPSLAPGHSGSFLDMDLDEDFEF